ncbi:MAG: hypothetical protein MJE63_20400 [Proteobacteria bacterium]|nr:hypothetical protein [Pseudomonadota bacterium]
MRRQTLKVPGNILLLGEYAILEEGGLGIAMAVDRNIAFHVEESDSFKIIRDHGNRQTHWKPEEPDSDTFLKAIYETIIETLSDDGLVQRIQKCKITIDSSSHHSPTGKKYGFGSSAVIASGLTKLVFKLAEMQKDKAFHFNLALQCHRRAQGNHGSGYDVAASVNGGIGLFHGGENPTWEPIRLPWLPRGYLIPGPESVSTVSAVKKYHQFKAANKRETERFYAFSNSSIEHFMKADNWETAAEILGSYQLESVQFQKKLGIDASTNAISNKLPGNKRNIVKSLGAGNELFSVWGIAAADLKSTIPIHLSLSGPEWM